MKWSQRLLLLLAVPLALAVVALALPASAAQAETCTPILVFTVQPTTTQVDTAMRPAVVVQVERPDEEGYQVDRSYNGPVVLTNAVSQDGAPEPSGNVVNAVNGVATFSDLTFSAVGFGFELRASIPDVTTSPASAPFDIVTQLVHCQPGRSCRSETVSSAGTSGSVTAAKAQTSDVLTATGGGFPLLSCTSYGGVLSFSVQNRSKVITVTLDKSVLKPAKQEDRWQKPEDRRHRHFNICMGSPVPFTTQGGTTSVFNPANNEYEGLLPFCRPRDGSQPCIRRQHETRWGSGDVVTTIFAPPGDPRITY